VVAENAKKDSNDGMLHREARYALESALQQSD
jgi:hypothetical protein